MTSFKISETGFGLCLRASLGGMHRLQDDVCDAGQGRNHHNDLVLICIAAYYASALPDPFCRAYRGSAKLHHDQSHCFTHFVKTKNPLRFWQWVFAMLIFWT